MSDIAWIHPFTVLGLDPDEAEINERSINRARKRSLADLQTGGSYGATDASDVTTASEALADPENLSLYFGVWSDEPLRRFLETNVLSWGAKIQHSDWYDEEPFRNLIIPALRNAVRQGVAQQLEKPDAEEMAALHILIDETELSAICEFHGVVSSVCGTYLDRIKAIENCLDSGDKDPDEFMTKEVIEQINPVFYNGLPLSLGDCREKAFRVIRGIAFTMHNSCGASRPALKILSVLARYVLPDRLAEQLTNDTRVISDIVNSLDAEEELRKKAPAIRSEIITGISALPLGNAKFRTLVASHILRIKTLVEPLSIEATQRAFDVCGIALRERSVEVWNSGDDDSLSIWLIEQAIELPCTPTLTKSFRGDLKTCCNNKLSSVSKSLMGAVEVLTEVQTMVIQHGLHRVNWSTFNNNVMTTCKAIESSHIITDLPHYFRHSKEISDIAAKWIRTLRRFTLGDTQPGWPATQGLARSIPIIRAHLRLYNNSWPSVRDLLIELEPRKTHGDGLLMPIMVAFGIIGVVTWGIWSNQVKENAARSIATTPPVPVVEGINNPKPTPVPAITPPPEQPKKKVDYTKVIDSALHERMTSLYYTDSSIPDAMSLLQFINDKDLDKALSERFDNATDDLDRWNLIVLMIRHGKDPQHIADRPLILATCRKGLKDSHSWVRTESVSAFGLMGSRADFPLIQPLINDEAPEVRKELARSSYQIAKRSLPPLVLIGSGLEQAPTGVASEAFIYDSLRSSRLIDVLRPLVNNDKVPVFNQAVAHHNRLYHDYRYYHEDMARAQSRIANDGPLIDAQARYVALVINAGDSIP